MASIRAMIPYCFAYDRLNYTRYLPYYYLEMSYLHRKHPEVYRQFQEKSKFSEQLSSSNPFGKVSVDQTIEETVNKDTQSAGGTKGFSLRPGAMAKFYLTSEYRSTFLNQLKSYVGQDRSKLFHTDLPQSRIRKQETDVQSVVEIMENDWLNPFIPGEVDILRISTGVTAPPEVSKNLLKARSIGKDAYQHFCHSRLADHSQPVPFHDKLNKQRLKSFSLLTALSKRKVNSNSL